LSNFTIDGDSNNYTVASMFVTEQGTYQSVKVTTPTLPALLWDVQDSQLTNSQLVNCSWGSTGFCAGALNLGNVQRVEVAQLMLMKTRLWN